MNSVIIDTPRGKLQGITDGTVRRFLPFIAHVSPIARAAQQHTDLTGAHLAEQLFFLDLRIGVVNKGNLLCRNAPGNQFGTNVIVNGERGFFLRRERGNVQFRTDSLFRFWRSLGCGKWR